MPRCARWAALLFLSVLGLSAGLLAPAGRTWLELSEGATGRRIAARLLPDGERVVLTWTNSLFRLPVTEVFVAGGGRVTLTEITFADPSGREPPQVRPEDVDDLYHTGGPFQARGLSRPFERVVFRVGEIGQPAMTFGGCTVRFVPQVGFGGSVVLTVRRGRPLDWLVREACPR
jgi:hypothetical protein